MDSSAADLHSKRREIVSLWDIHRNADWPDAIGSQEGELMTLDTVMGGCVTFFLEENGLDPPRVVILQDCLNELDCVLGEMESGTKEYFERLQTVGALLLEII